MNNFNIGDRVELIEYYHYRLPGDTGIVVDIEQSPFGKVILLLKMEEYFKNNNIVECYESRVKRWSNNNENRYNGGY